MTIGKILAISGVALCLAACQDKKKPEKPAVKPAKVMTLTVPITSTKRYFPGKVEASNRVNLSFQVKGRVEKFPVLEGDELKIGAVIAKLDPSEFQYNLNQAQSKYNLTQSQENRYATLLKDGHVAHADYDREKSAFDVAKADLKQAKKDLSDTILKAPFDGVIVRKYVKLYQQIKPNEQIVSFQDMTQVDIRVSLPENVIAQTKKEKDRDLTVSFEALPKRSFKATVKEFSAEADPETQTFDAILTMPAPKNANILPGMTATLLLNLPINNSHANNVYMIPAAAVFKSEAGASSVWLVTPNTNKVTLQSVTTGKLSGSDIAILKGLKAGDVIVTAGVHFLQPDEKIKPLMD